MKRRITGLALVAVLLAAQAGVAGVCEPLKATSENVMEFGQDYRPRLDFHHPDDLALCGAAVVPDEVLEFVLYAWNVGRGVEEAKFRIVSNGDIVGFQPSGGFDDSGAGGARPDGSLSVLDLHLTGPTACGPFVVGVAKVTPREGQSSVYVDLEGYGGLGLPLLTDASGAELPAVAPYHGAYAGAADYYHCQPPLCAEPLAAVDDLTAVQTGGTVIELGWTAGDGDVTIIRYRDDGVHPASLFDGEELVRFPAQAGAWQTVIHSNPAVPRYWYTAFNVRLEGGEPVAGSLLECGSFVDASVDESIAAEESSWSAIKRRYR